MLFQHMVSAVIVKVSHFHAPGLIVMTAELEAAGKSLFVNEVPEMRLVAEMIWKNGDYIARWLNWNHLYGTTMNYKILRTHDRLSHGLLTKQFFETSIDSSTHFWCFGSGRLASILSQVLYTHTWSVFHSTKQLEMGHTW